MDPVYPDQKRGNYLNAVCFRISTRRSFSLRVNFFYRCLTFERISSGGNFLFIRENNRATGRGISRSNKSVIVLVQSLGNIICYAGVERAIIAPDDIDKPHVSAGGFEPPTTPHGGVLYRRDPAWRFFIVATPHGGVLYR